VLALPARFLAVVATLLTSAPAAAQTQGALTDPETWPRPETRIGPGTGIVIDGRLDEAAWREADPITRFVQAQPDEGHPASETTEVRIVHDAGYLYLGVLCHDSEPDELVVQTLERDFPGVLSEDMDTFGVTLDTFLDRRNSFIFFVNPRGGVKDGQGFDDGRIRDYGWDGVVEVKTTVHDGGWTAEIAIPWKTLRFDPGRDRQTWGMNLLRRIRRKNEVSYWAPLDRRDRFFRMSKAGTVRGLRQLPAGRNLTVKPFALATRSSGRSLAGDASGNELDAGVDVKYGITPQLTVDLTYRTDFSQVEVDQEQVNLTRFPLFFPERREFFLENSGTFAFGDVDNGPGSPRSGTSLRDFTLFHSREIGLDQGRPVPLLGGARLTGRIGGLELGILDVQSETFEDRPAENFAAVRLRHRLFDNSDVGLIFTNRESTGTNDGDAYNRAIGADSNLRFGVGLFLNSFLAVTHTPEARDEAARVAVGYRDRFWNASMAFRHVGNAFDPGIGFVRRRGIRDAYATLGVHPRPSVERLLEVNPYVEVRYIEKLASGLETRTGRLGLGIVFQDGGRLNASYTDRFERLDEPFPVRPESPIPIGDYRFGEASLRYSSSQGRRLSTELEVSGGGYFGGRRFTVSGSARWQPDYHVTLEAAATHNALTVQGRSFSADLYSARAKIAYSTSLYFGAFVQYNAEAEQLVTNVRVNFIHAPLSDFFLVLTERRDISGGGVLERFATAKITRLVAF
jgi:hypothetical protein